MGEKLRSVKQNCVWHDYTGDRLTQLHHVDPRVGNKTALNYLQPSEAWDLASRRLHVHTLTS